jgi:hypothetical protein
LYPYYFSRIYEDSVGAFSMLAVRAETRASETFGGLRPKLSINFEEVIWLTHGNIEEKNNVLDSSVIIIIINYYIIIINAYDNYIIN